MKIFLLPLFLFLINYQAKCQVKDTAKNFNSRPAFPNQNPKLAGWLSAALPGAGQVYNRKIWKVAVLYAGIAGIAYSINFNNKYYHEFTDAYKIRIDDDSLTFDIYDDKNSGGSDIKYTNENLVTLKEYYRRNRDLSIIIAVGVYFSNILDAIVDAHLMQMELSKDMLLSIHPQLNWSISGYKMKPIPGFCIKLGI